MYLLNDQRYNDTGDRREGERKISGTNKRTNFKPCYNRHKKKREKKYS